MSREKVRYLPWLASQFVIAPFAGVVTVVCLALFVAGGSFTTVMMLGGDGDLTERLATSLQGFAGYGAVVAVPLLFVIGKVRGDGAMALIGLFVAALSALGVVGGFIAHTVHFGWMFALFLTVWHGIIIVPVGILGFAAFTSGWGQVRSGWRRAQSSALRNYLERAGWAQLDALADLVSAEEDEVRSMVKQLRLQADEQDDVLWMRSDRDEKATRALQMVAARGRVHVRDLGRHLKLRPTMVKRLVHHLSSSSSFTGWVDWENGLVVSQQASQLEHGEHCPRCAGELRLEGVGVIACRHCGSEIFLPRAA